jgi:DNA primase small subunit
MDEDDLSFLTTPVASSVIEHKPTILRNLEARKADFLNVPGVGKASRDKFLERCMELNGQTVDGKVTIDTKRILRLPSTLHSKISMICMLVDNPETFDPLSKAVPRFVEER